MSSVKELFDAKKLRKLTSSLEQIKMLSDSLETGLEELRHRGNARAAAEWRKAGHQGAAIIGRTIYAEKLEPSDRRKRLGAIDAMRDKALSFEAAVVGRNEIRQVTGTSRGASKRSPAKPL
jgi:hypothetical protein